MGKNSIPSVKDEETYEALRREGASKSKAARIANSKGASKRGGKADAYEEWTREELYERAKELDIDRRSKMSKNELIDALRTN